MTKHLPDLHHVDELKNFAANNIFRLVIEVAYWDPRNLLVAQLVSPIRYWGKGSTVAW